MTNKFIPPQTTTLFREAATPISGEILFDVTNKFFYGGDGTTEGGRKILFSDNVALEGGLTFPLIGTPSAPPVGKVTFYYGNDQKFKIKDEAGTVTEVGLYDGNKGDITITSGVWNLNNSVVELANIQNIGSKKILGNPATISGVVAEVTLGTGLTLTNLGVLNVTSTALQIPTSSSFVNFVPSAANVERALVAIDTKLGEPTTVIINSNTTAVAGTRYLLNSGAGTFTVTLPIGNDNDRIEFADWAGSNPGSPTGLGLNPVNIVRSGSNTIQGQTTISLSVENKSISLVFHTGKWVVVSMSVFV